MAACRNGVSLCACRTNLRLSKAQKYGYTLSNLSFRYHANTLTESLDTKRMDDIVALYQKSETDKERAWYLAEYARIDEVRQMYFNISVDPFSKNAVKRIVQLILENEGAVLFHCTNGKDRTGVLAAIILYSLGCIKEDIIRDYNASALVYAAKAELFKAELQEHNYSKELQHGVQTILSVVPEVIAAGLYYVNINCNADHDYILRNIGVEQDEIRKFRNKYLA